MDKSTHLKRVSDNQRRVQQKDQRLTEYDLGVRYGKLIESINQAGESGATIEEIKKARSLTES